MSLSFKYTFCLEVFANFGGVAKRFMVASKRHRDWSLALITVLVNSFGLGLQMVGVYGKPVVDKPSQ